ncbi:kinase-like domain-containing protein [Polychytrium aggregatum]|uniref:kinase-like domain-containing protein n=1 Tax=Polychytrium aggregatum TaxID=110093 RepID=UPI0022FE78BB|nr:kinase-like domain-containing protein [Polychytrium aggregatum]KAI9205615.1 kinase-like domain-containing protein [Polychytrium aggregatum]
MQQFDPNRLNPSFSARYVLRDMLGSGGFGFVYVAQRLCDGVEVAVKFIRKSKVHPNSWILDSDLGWVPSEVFILKRIQHPNVIRFLEYYDDDHFGYLITEIHGAPWTSSREALDSSLNGSTGPVSTGFPSPLTPNSCEWSQSSTGTYGCPHPPSVDSLASATSPPISPAQSLDGDPAPKKPPSLTRKSSRDLFECIEQHQRFTEDQAKFVMKQILTVVRDLHALGIIHRDLKDENILINERFEVKLIDFGSATIVAPAQPVVFNSFQGTVQFASPEMLRGERYGGIEADVWALGTCLYIMLTGDAPFQSIQQASFGKINEPRCPLSNEAVHLIYWMLCVSPHERATLLDALSHPWFYC